MNRIKTSISLEEKTLAKIKAKADSEKRSVSNWINARLEEHFLKPRRATKRRREAVPA